MKRAIGTRRSIGSSATAACVLGGSAVTRRFGKLRIYHEVRPGPPSRDGCAPATLDGSVSGGGWSLPLRSGGRWCGRETTLRYRLGGPRGGTGTISYRRSPLGTASETLRGALPAPPAGVTATGDRPIPSRGCGHRPPLRVGSSANLVVAADPALAAA